LASAHDRSRLEGVRRLLVVIALVCAAGVLVQSAAAAKPTLGVLGDTNRFRALTGQQSQVGHVIVGWGH
jgi:hypothetical protein